jgi:AraC-like DNA-binding protein
MSPSIDPITIIFLLGAAQAVFFAVLLLRARHHANRYLAAFLVVFATALVDEFLLSTGHYRDVPRLLGVFWPLDFLYGPLLYIYTRALTAPLSLPPRAALMHFVPFLFSSASHAPYILLDVTEKVDLVFAPTTLTAYHTVMSLNTLAAMTQILVYLLFVILHLRRHTRAIAQTLSYRDGVDLRWLRNLTLVCVTLWALYVLRDLLLPLAGMAGAAYWSLPIAIAVAVYALGYFGHRQPELFGLAAITVGVRGDAPENLPKRSEAGIVKYQKSALAASQALAVHEQLIAMMQADKPYRDSDLSLLTLAQRLGVSTHHLSQVINEHAGCNFFDFVNAYRVREAQTLLADPAEQRGSILALSMEAGFKSKSAFYNAFRKHVGMTPAQYRASLAGVATNASPSV